MDMELKGKVIHFLGDSITEGYTASRPENRYVDLIAAQTGAICNNYGISGTRIARQTTPSRETTFDQCFCDRADGMDENADIVVVFGGTNDYGHGDAPLGTLDDTTDNTFCGAVNVLSSKLKTKYPRAEIVVFTPLHRENEDDPRGEASCKPADVAPLSEYVWLLLEIAAKWDLPVFDLYHCSAYDPTVPEKKQRYTADGLHPNDEGFRLLADEMIGFLRTL